MSAVDAEKARDEAHGRAIKLLRGQPLAILATKKGWAPELIDFVADESYWEQIRDDPAE